MFHKLPFQFEVANALCFDRNALYRIEIHAVFNEIWQSKLEK